MFDAVYIFHFPSKKNDISHRHFEKKYKKFYEEEEQEEQQFTFTKNLFVIGLVKYFSNTNCCFLNKITKLHISLFISLFNHVQSIKSE